MNLLIIKVADIVKTEFIDKSWLGVRSGQRFFIYADSAYSRSAFLSGDPARVSAGPTTPLCTLHELPEIPFRGLDVLKIV